MQRKIPELFLFKLFPIRPYSVWLASKGDTFVCLSDCVTVSHALGIEILINPTVGLIKRTLLRLFYRHCCTAQTVDIKEGGKLTEFVCTNFLIHIRKFVSFEYMESYSIY